jgi:hypothetical protein
MWKTLTQAPQLLRDRQLQLQRTYLAVQEKKQFHVHIAAQEEIEMAVYHNESEVAIGDGGDGVDGGKANQLVVKTDLMGDVEMVQVQRYLRPLFDAVSLQNEVCHVLFDVALCGVVLCCVATHSI